MITITLHPNHVKMVADLVNREIARRVLIDPETQGWQATSLYAPIIQEIDRAAAEWQKSLDSQSTTPTTEQDI